VFWFRRSRADPVVIGGFAPAPRPPPGWMPAASSLVVADVPCPAWGLPCGHDPRCGIIGGDRGAVGRRRSGKRRQAPADHGAHEASVSGVPVVELPEPEHDADTAPSLKRSACASATRHAMPTGGGSSGASSSIHASPASAYMKAMDSWRKRTTPAVSEASTRRRDASDRMRLFSAQALAGIARDGGGIVVARLMTHSWPSTARTSCARSNRLTPTGVAPTARTRSAFSFVERARSPRARPSRAGEAIFGQARQSRR